ncbi:MAG: bis(5'-nucleosyl)-tetraphosphatase [Patescibacteria group bacterium]
MENKRRNRVTPREVVEKSCGVLLVRKEAPKHVFLLLHYPSGHWDFPKGHVEKHDADELATASRELEEETGIKEARFHPTFREPIYYEFNRGKRELVKKTVVYFLAQTREKEIKVSMEHQDFIWLPYDEALEQLTFENAKGLLRKAESVLQAHAQS